MKKSKISIIWIAAFIITIAAAVFQRMTGPTHPFKEKIVLNNSYYKLKLPRSLETGQDSKITLPIQDNTVIGKVSYRIYPSKITFTTDTLTYSAKGMEFLLPQQKAAGKLEYRITLTDDDNTYETPFLLVRYKDPVPAIWLIPHILIMFMAMLVSIATGIMAVLNYGNYVRTLLIAGVLLFLGGLVLGPIVQKYAFGEFWAGIPFGWDLTDNKTLIAMLFFIFAIIKNFKNPSRIWTIVAVLVLLVIYSIPHSMYGSELDPETGRIIQGSVGNIPLLIASVSMLIKKNF